MDLWKGTSGINCPLTVRENNADQQASKKKEKEQRDTIEIEKEKQTFQWYSELYQELPTHATGQ